MLHRAGAVRRSGEQADQEQQRSSGKITLGAGKLISQVCISSRMCLTLKWH